MNDCFAFHHSKTFTFIFTRYLHWNLAKSNLLYDQVWSLEVLLTTALSLLDNDWILVFGFVTRAFSFLVGIFFFFFWFIELFKVKAWLAMSSRNARKPNWAWEASLRARDRMQALYCSVDNLWPGPPEHTYDHTNHRFHALI